MNDNENVDSVKFSVGEKKFSYVPYSFDELILDVTPQPLKICMENNKCISVDLTLNSELYFKVSHQSSSNNIAEVPKSEGSFDSFTCEKKQKKRIKRQSK